MSKTSRMLTALRLSTERANKLATQLEQARLAASAVRRQALAARKGRSKNPQLEAKWAVAKEMVAHYETKLSVAKQDLAKLEATVMVDGC